MNDNSLDIARAMSIVSARWKLVSAVTIGVMLVAFSYTQLSPEKFEATARVNYQAPAQDSNPYGLPNSGDRRSNMDTLAANAQSPELQEKARKKLGMGSAQELASAARVQVYGEANILNFTATADSAGRAEEIANKYAQTFADDTKNSARTQLKIQKNQLLVKLKPLVQVQDDPAASAVKAQLAMDLNKLDTDDERLKQSLPTTKAHAVQVWPRTMMTLFAAVFLGFGVGCGAALISARVDRSLHEENVGELPLQLLMRVPKASHAPTTTPLTPHTAEPVISDAFAAMGSRILLDRSGDGAHVVLVTSARSGEGKSTVASNLAAAVAQSGRRVVLVDADLRRPTQDTVFPSLQGRPGLSQVLLGDVDAEQALSLVAPNLAAIGSGPQQLNASTMLASLAFRSLVSRLSEISDIVIIDAPPVLAVSDALSVSPLADQVLVCARLGVTQTDEVSVTHSRLLAASTTPQALVLIGTERPTGYGYDQVPASGTMPALHPGQAAGSPASGVAEAAAQPSAPPAQQAHNVAQRGSVLPASHHQQQPPAAGQPGAPNIGQPAGGYSEQSLQQPQFMHSQLSSQSGGHGGAETPPEQPGGRDPGEAVA